LGGLLFCSFFKELRLRFFALKFVKYDSILLILKQKFTKNALKQAKRSALADVSCKKSSQTGF